MSNYPPGVSGNEPHITGIWPCIECGGAGFDEDEDGKWSCPRCKGSGNEPEEFDNDYLQSLIDANAPRWLTEGIIEWARCIHWDRHDPEQRKQLKLICQLWDLTGRK